MDMTACAERQTECADGKVRDVQLQAFLYRERFGIALWAVPAAGVGAVMFLLPNNSRMDSSGVLSIESFNPDMVFSGVQTVADVLAELMAAAVTDPDVAQIFAEADKIIDS
jgi:hypothetical protein